jgi:phosphopantothenoylcysteine decarboxylase/phosphopantothenate--cysteine ligase
VPDPPGVRVVHVESAREMLEAAQAALPADCAVFAAAVADWRVETAVKRKLKKSPRGDEGPCLVTPGGPAADPSTPAGRARLCRAFALHP